MIRTLLIVSIVSGMFGAFLAGMADAPDRAALRMLTAVVAAAALHLGKESP